MNETNKKSEKPTETEFTKKWRIHHKEPMAYNERIINSACDIIDRLTAEGDELKDLLRKNNICPVCGNHINSRDGVHTCTLKGE